MKYKIKRSFIEPKLRSYMIKDVFYPASPIESFHHIIYLETKIEGITFRSERIAVNKIWFRLYFRILKDQIKTQSIIAGCTIY